MKDKNKIEFDMWERQVLAAATDHSDTAIRQAMLQSLKGQALMVTTTLPPNTHWKELLQALRIKYQSKAPYDVLMSQFYSTKMDTSEDCASFGIRLEQKLNQLHYNIQTRYLLRFIGTMSKIDFFMDCPQS